jgi:hypothetical protein
MPKIRTDDVKPQRKLFHNEWINVYPKTLSLNQIKFWPEYNRTIFTFERLARDYALDTRPLSDKLSAW